MENLLRHWMLTDPVFKYLYCPVLECCGIVKSCCTGYLSIATSYGLEDRGSIPGRLRDFSLLHSVQTDSGAHPVGTREFLPGGLSGRGV
jgi:hypothetical protein